MSGPTISSRGVPVVGSMLGTRRQLAVVQVLATNTVQAPTVAVGESERGKTRVALEVRSGGGGLDSSFALERSWYRFPQIAAQQHCITSNDQTSVAYMESKEDGPKTTVPDAPPVSGGEPGGQEHESGEVGAARRGRLHANVTGLVLAVLVCVSVYLAQREWYTPPWLSQQLTPPLMRPVMAIAMVTFTISLVVAYYRWCPQDKPTALEALIRRYGIVGLKWFVSVAVFSSIIFLYNGNKQYFDQQEQQAAQRRDLSRGVADSMSQFRAALTEFGSDCVPRSMRSEGDKNSDAITGAARLSTENCSKLYERVVDGWVRATWVLPLFIRDVMGSDACRAMDAESTKRAGTTGRVRTEACRRLRGAGAMAESSWSYRKFVNAYAAFVGGRSKSSVALREATADLFLQTRKLGCSVIVASDWSSENKQPIPSCYCTLLLGAPPEGACMSPDAGMTDDGEERDQLDWPGFFDQDGGRR